MSDIPQISVDALPAGAAILDVREDDEWVAGHIDGATHIPLAELPQRVRDLPDGDPIHVICRAGGRSQKAAEWLARQGIEVANVDGGMRAWSAGGKPMVADSGEPIVL